MRTVPLASAITTMSLVGCTSTHHYVVARLKGDALNASEPAPALAAYTVAMKSPADRNYTSLAPATVHVPRGTPLGFERTPTAVFAYAGEYRFKVAAPEGSRFAWQATVTKSAGVPKVVRRAGQLALWTGGFALVIAADVAMNDAIDAAEHPHPHRHHRRTPPPACPTDADSDETVIGMPATALLAAQAAECAKSKE